MFGKMGDMLGKMQEMKQKSDEIKARLNTISVNAEVENGLVKVICTGNRKITSISYNENLIKEGDQEKIEELTVIAINKVLEKAEKVNEAEMAGVAKGMLPGLF